MTKYLYDENKEKVKKAFEEYYQDYQSYLSSWSNVARRSVSYVNGDQNPIPYGNSVIINNQPVSDYRFDTDRNAYYTNEIEPIVRTLQAYMTRSQPAVKAMAQGHDSKSRSISMTSEAVLAAKYDIDDEITNSQLSAWWLLTTGSVFGKDYWNPNCGTLLKNGNYSGNSEVATLTGFSMIMDHSITDFNKQNYVGDAYLMDVEWAREAFDVNGPGYTGRAQYIRQDNVTSDVISSLEAMKFAVPYVSQGYGNRQAGKDKVLIKSILLKPTKEWPKGREIIIAGNEVVFISDKGRGSSYYMPFEPIMWHPYTHTKFEPYLGRLLGKSLVEQLVPLQMRVNEINKTILENANTMAKPNVLAYQGTLARGVLNGRGANVYTWTNPKDFAHGVAPAPQLWRGEPLPSQFFQEKQSLIDRMVMISGTNFAMQGQPPTGVTAAAAIEMLLENASGQHSALMNSWRRFHEERYTKKLRVIHKFMKYPNKELTRKIKEYAKDNYNYQDRDFIGVEDLSDGINIKIEASSMIPKSEIVKNNTYLTLAKEGALGPYIGEDSPRGDKFRNSLVEKVGLQPIVTETNVEIKKADWENENMLRGQMMGVSEFDIDEIHLQSHKGKIQDPHTIENTDPEILELLGKHIKLHEENQKRKKEEAMAEQMQQAGGQLPPPPGMQPPPPPPGEGIMPASPPLPGPPSGAPQLPLEGGGAPNRLFGNQLNDNVF